jgi:hypothetical protein
MRNESRSRFRGDKLHGDDLQPLVNSTRLDSCSKTSASTYARSRYSPESVLTLIFSPSTTKGGT